jgi:hypothetical protein
MFVEEGSFHYSVEVFCYVYKKRMFMRLSIKRQRKNRIVTKLSRTFSKMENRTFKHLVQLGKEYFIRGKLLMTGKEKLIRIPISYKQRKINEYGEGYVPCEVSERWIQFPDEISDERYIPISIMTTGSKQENRKICELVVSMDDLLGAIKKIKVKG